MNDVNTILITGANGGLGKECARQLALLPSTTKVILGCRSPERAEAARRALEHATGRSIFEILVLDLSDLDSVRKAAVEAPIVDALVLNAGGTGGSDANMLTKDGVTRQFAVNVLGHAALAESLLEADKVRSVVVYAGSEAARGVPEFRMAQPSLETMFGHAHSVEAGAKRYLDAISDEHYATGVFYGNEKKTVGPLTDQAEFFPDLRNAAFQDNARSAIHRFIG